MRPTIHHVAEVAKLSTATVDRVLNNRGGVSQKTIDKVMKAVTRTGYVRDIAAANLSRQRQYRFAFLLPDVGTGFVTMLKSEIAREQERLAADRTVIDILQATAFDTASQVSALKELSGDGLDGLALFASEAPEVQAEIARLVGEGVKVVTLVSDLPRSSRNIYVGPDNVVAGRTAANFMGRFIRATQGNVLMVAGSLSARDHMERVMGFRTVMGESFSHLTVLPAVQGKDDADTVRALVQEAMETAPLVGVYAVGAGIRGLIAALEGAKPRPVAIVHELTDVTRAGLRSGEIDLVIDQNPGAEIRAALSLMRDLTDDRQIAPSDGTIPLNIFVRENI